MKKIAKKPPPNKVQSAGIKKEEPQHMAKVPPVADVSKPRGFKKTPKRKLASIRKKVECKTDGDKNGGRVALVTPKDNLGTIYHEVGILCKRAVRIMFVKCLPETIEVTLHALVVFFRIGLAILHSYHQA